MLRVWHQYWAVSTTFPDPTADGLPDLHVGLECRHLPGNDPRPHQVPQWAQWQWLPGLPRRKDTQCQSRETEPRDDNVIKSEANIGCLLHKAGGSSYSPQQHHHGEPGPTNSPCCKQSKAQQTGKPWWRTCRPLHKLLSRATGGCSHCHPHSSWQLPCNEKEWPGSQRQNPGSHFFHPEFGDCHCHRHCCHHNGSLLQTEVVSNLIPSPRNGHDQQHLSTISYPPPPPPHTHTSSKGAFFLSFQVHIQGEKLYLSDFVRLKNKKSFK